MCENNRSRGTLHAILTQVLPPLVLVDVDVDFLDSLQSLSELGPVVVALGRGPQQLHEQQRVAHDPLHRLDEERAQVDVVCFAPGPRPKKKKMDERNQNCPQRKHGRPC